MFNNASVGESRQKSRLILNLFNSFEKQAIGQSSPTAPSWRIVALALAEPGTAQSQRKGPIEQHQGDDQNAYHWQLERPAKQEAADQEQ